MAKSTINLHKLRSMIGRRVRYRGRNCQIIEVLEDGPSLVLQDYAEHKIIQTDQHGEAHRRVAPTFTVPLRESGTGEVSSDFLELDLLDS